MWVMLRAPLCVEESGTKAGGLGNRSCIGARTLPGGGRGCQGEGPGRRVPCFRAHDETVAIAYGVVVRSIALVDELRVSTRRVEHPGCAVLSRGSKGLYVRCD